ncbi:MAG: hypothetical protein OEV23_04680 [Gallionella sp.]|nr:hypothetical protein [Gallionella sp.]
MDIAKQIVATLVIVVTAILGTFVINSFALLLFEGKTINNGYLLTLVGSVLYTVWFLALAYVGAMFLKPRPLLALGIAAFLVFCYLAFSGSDWVNPELSFSQKVVSYLHAYVASFMVLPAFLLVGFLVQRAAPNLAFKRDALKRAP